MMTLLPWQNTIWLRLQQMRDSGRLPHALLFSGPQGVGKELFAQLFAKSLLCQEPDSSGLPCGHCQPCHLLVSGVHPDFTNIAPDAESKSGEILVDTIRGLAFSTTLTSTAGSHRIVLLRPAERMSNSAANAFLKTLEEPPLGTLMILISDRPSRLLPTIRSRCQLIGFATPPAEQALPWLEAQVNHGDPAMLLALAGGAPLRALELDDSVLLEQRDSLLTAFIALAEGRTDPVKVAADWAKQDLNMLFEWWSGWLIDLLQLQAVEQPVTLFNKDRRETFKQLAERLDSGELQRNLQRLYRARQDVEANLNSQLLLESLTIDWTGRAANR